MTVNIASYFKSYLVAGSSKNLFEFCPLIIAPQLKKLRIIFPVAIKKPLCDERLLLFLMKYFFRSCLRRIVAGQIADIDYFT